jgi:outer membrane lipoprotein carrier protein
MNRRDFAWSTLAGASVLVVSSLAFADQPKAPPAAKPAAPAASGLSAEEIADRVQQFYDKTKTFRAGFRQVYKATAYNKVKESTGSVVFEKPGKMSWRYTNNGNRVVSDGKIIRIYEKENRQMYEQPLEKSQYPAALSFLIGGASLKQTFKFTKADSKAMNFEGGYVIVGEPKDATPAYQKVFMYIDGPTFQVRRVVLLDAQRNRNTFTFLAPEVNLKPPTGEFNFAPPAGTQVIRP